MSTEIENLIIRKATLADTFTLVEHRNRFLEELYNFCFQDLKIIAHNNQNYYKEKLAEGNYIALLAEYNGNPVASTGMILKEFPQKGIEKKRIVATVVSVYTHPEYRKNGIAEKLINEMVAEARKSGISKLELLATPNGETVYKKAGFKEPDDRYLELYL
ncbi:MAG: GNAT family N-acetyltransferase [Spirochaetes bacterium]|nr:GNAT family N-acetyltransferase [Spirochaetota bacterium]